MVIDQNEPIFSKQYLRRNNICDLSWQKESSYCNSSFDCVKSNHCGKTWEQTFFSAWILEINLLFKTEKNSNQSPSQPHIAFWESFVRTICISTPKKMSKCCTKTWKKTCYLHKWTQPTDSWKKSRNAVNGKQGNWQLEKSQGTNVNRKKSTGLFFEKSEHSSFLEKKWLQTLWISKTIFDFYSYYSLVSLPQNAFLLFVLRAIFAYFWFNIN